MSRASQDDVDQDAAHWVARMDSADWTARDDAALGAWIAHDPRHRGALLHAQALWISLDGGEEQQQEMSEPPVREGRQMVRRRTVLVGGGMAIAASFAGGLLYLSTGDSYATGIGEMRRVPLEDGSIAAINTDSRIEVAMAAGARQVRLDKGEAWFQVARDPGRPFLVEAGRIRVEAVGTAFSIRRRENGADVVVTEGAVNAWAASAEGHRIRIAAGHMAFIADNARIVPMPSVGGPAIERTLAWRNGKIDLAGARVSDAIAEFNRYNARKLILESDALADEQIDGVFRTDDPEGFARAVGGSFAAPVDFSDARRIRIGGRGS